ncbi:MAG: hypothetical protein F6K41_36550 [Symploca sp. SIO3E6]|nr:hypothetical protein [Caldora sp. SIO3E6]
MSYKEPSNAPVIQWLVIGGLSLIAIFLGYKVILSFPGVRIILQPPENPSQSPQSLSEVPSSPPPAPSIQAPINKPSSSPERVLKSYVRSMTDRDFTEVSRISPKADIAYVKRWLQGTSTKPQKIPISRIEVVGEPKRISTYANEAELVLRAKLQYCREDGSGSTDIKNYTFIQNQGMWQLDSMTAPEDVTLIRC